MTLATDTRPMPLVDAPLESRRFGMAIARGRSARIDPIELAGEIRERRLDVAIVRQPAGAPSPADALDAVGLECMHADTLVEYVAPLDAMVPAPPRNADLQFVAAGASDAAVVEALVRASFPGYRSHYAANPLFDGAAILAGYVEWASGFLGRPGCDTWLALRDGRAIGFACCEMTPDGDASGVLYGVHPADSGGGVYTDLIRHTLAVHRARGHARMHVSTQVQNIAVQKVWSREGFVLDAALDTFHVVALLAAGNPLLRLDASRLALPGIPEAVARGACIPEGGAWRLWSARNDGEGRPGDVLHVRDIGGSGRRLTLQIVDSTGELAAHGAWRAP